jgi:hypothetical protein
LRIHRNPAATGLSCSLWLVSCGGSGGTTGSATPLSVPSQMTIVEAQGGQAGNLRAGGAQVPGVLYQTTGTDYDTDPTRIWVHDESMDPLDTINMILCMLDQTGYQDPTVLNTGPYVVLVNESRCESRGADPSGGEQSQATGVVGYQEWTVDSRRESAGAPQTVRFWIDWDEDSGNGSFPARLYGRLVIHESPSASAPYGKFVLDFKLLDRQASHDGTDYIFRGTLSTVDRADGQAEYTFWMTEGDFDSTPAAGESARLVRARVVTDAAGSSGRAYSSVHEKRDEGMGLQTELRDYHLRFNDRYLARKKVDVAEQVEVFDRQNFDTYPWRYGLYRADTEARVALQSGFGVRTTAGHYGYVGYHGMWFPPEVTIQTGTELIRQSFDPNSGGTTYTAFVAKGKLEKRVRTASTLGNLKGESLRTHDHAAGTMLRVQWTGTDLVKTGVWNHSTRDWTPVDPPVSILGSYQPEQWVGLYSDARGEVNLVWPQSNPTDGTPVSIWTTSFITADSPELANGDLTLHAYYQMPRSQITLAQANYQNGQSPFFPDATNLGEGKTYVFEKSSLTLLLQGAPVTLALGVDPTGGPSSGGIYGGPMVTSPLQNFADLNSQPVTYRWQTGTRDWNQLRVIKDGNGAFVAFDPPMVFFYTHDEPAKPTYHGKSYKLEYMGRGDLHGIPYFKEPGTNRWYAAFGIPSGTVLTNSTGSYLVKVLEAEQRMIAVQNPQQVITEQGLGLDTTLTPPTDTWTEPGIGAKPSVDAPPLYIDGQRQSG